MKPETVLKQKILSGQVSLRELSRQTGIDREKLKLMIEEMCTPEESKELQRILESNKKESTTVELEESLKEAIIKVLKGEMSAKQASKEYGINSETLRRKAEELANASPEYIKYYIEYKGKRGDYSGINFRRVIIEMIENNMTQIEIAGKYGIPIRTVSRELEKIGKSQDEQDKKLYRTAKMYAEKKEKHQAISLYEQKTFGEFFEELKQKNKFVVLGQESDSEKRKKELIEFTQKVNELKKSGMTNEQIAKQLGVGISTIRRRTLELKEIREIEEKDERE